MTVTKWKLIKDYPRALRIKGIGAQYIRFAIMIGSWLDEPNWFLSNQKDQKDPSVKTRSICSLLRQVELKRCDYCTQGIRCTECQIHIGFCPMGNNIQFKLRHKRTEIVS
jgi:hypothetical protein